MAFRIKFSAGTAHKSERTIPRRSVVQVYFAANHRSLAYYNDRFDLKPGDLVFVDGKLAGQRCAAATMLRFGQKSEDEFFVSYPAASNGVLVENASAYEPLVMLKHYPAAEAQA